MKIQTCLFLLCFLFLSHSGNSQDFWNRCGDEFDRSKYPADSFKIKQKTFLLGNTQIILSLVHYDIAGDVEFTFMAWLEQWRENKRINSKYLGADGSESGVRLPQKQLLKDFFVIQASGEFTGVFYLISKRGKWYEIPGAGMILDKEKKILYTYVPVECGGCPVGKFSLRSRKLNTKMWGGEGVGWKEVGNKNDCLQVFGTGMWIQWKSF